MHRCLGCWRENEEKEETPLADGWDTGAGGGWVSENANVEMMVVAVDGG